MILFLVGYAGSGKSSLAKRLSRKLGMKQLDTDKLVEEREGASVADIFFYQGEEYFRRAERDVVEELAASKYEGIVATGGGLPTWNDNMERMNRLGSTVYLRRTAEQIASRLSPHGRQKRPKLRGLNDEELVAFMTANMAEREPFYSQATHCVDCVERSDAELIDYILDIVKSNE